MMEQKKQRPRVTKRQRPAGDAPTGCGYVVEWRPLTSLEGMTPVWIPNAQYEKVAAAVEVPQDDTAAVYVCECSYFV